MLLCIGTPRGLALKRASLLISVLLLSAPDIGAELTKEAKRQIVGEWSKKTGFARRDLNNVQILPNFRMSIRTDSEDLIPAGSNVAVIEVDIEEDRRAIGLDVRIVGSKRWTEQGRHRAGRRPGVLPGDHARAHWRSQGPPCRSEGPSGSNPELQVRGREEYLGSTECPAQRQVAASERDDYGENEEFRTRLWLDRRGLRTQSGCLPSDQGNTPRLPKPTCLR
jgi:hypothetical protein